MAISLISERAVWQYNWKKIETAAYTRVFHVPIKK